jgi:hypothetical protein
VAGFLCNGSRDGRWKKQNPHPRHRDASAGLTPALIPRNYIRILDAPLIRHSHPVIKSQGEARRTWGRTRVRLHDSDVRIFDSPEPTVAPLQLAPTARSSHPPPPPAPAAPPDPNLPHRTAPLLGIRSLISLICDEGTTIIRSIRRLPYPRYPRPTDILRPEVAGAPEQCNFV